MVNDSATNNNLAQITRSIELLVRLKLQEVRGDKSQREMILLLDSFDCTPSEIAKLLGTTTTSVSPVLSRSRKQKKG